MDMQIAGFHPPTQDRSEATLARITRATEALLAKRGSGLTVGDVVARARTSVGSFYARFDDKDAAIRYTQERFWETLRGEWERYLEPHRWRGVPAIGIAARVIRTLVWNQLRHGRRLRAFMLDALAGPRTAVLERTVALDRHVAARVADLVTSRQGVTTDPAERHLATAGVLCVLSAVRDQVLLGGLPGADGAATARELTVVLIEMYAGLLGLKGAPHDYGQVVRLCAPRDAGWR